MTSALSAGLSVQCSQVRHVYTLDGEDVVALEGVDLSIHPGESVALLGPSGSGKSTLLTLMAGLLRPTAGSLFVGADDITKMTERQLLGLRGQRIGVVLQNPSRNLLAYGTAEDNIRFAQRPAGRYRRQQLPAPLDLLTRLGLESLAGQRVARMSGGEQQRLTVAMGMANAPGLLLADEPTSQLDGASRDRVVQLLARITSAFGTTVVAVTHDPDVAAALGRTVTMSEGRADDTQQHRDQYATLTPDGSVRLPADVRFPPGARIRVVRKPSGVELVAE